MYLYKKFAFFTTLTKYPVIVDVVVALVFAVDVVVVVTVETSCIASTAKVDSLCVIIFVTPGSCCNIRYPSETHLKLKSREISIAHNYLIINSFWNFAQSTEIPLSLSVQLKKGLTTEIGMTSDLSKFRSFRFVPRMQKKPILPSVTVNSLRQWVKNKPLFSCDLK